MRTQQEILEYTTLWMGEGPLDFRADVTMPFLSYRNAKVFLKDHVTEAMWNGMRSTRSSRGVWAGMQGYITFACEKAIGHRSLSAVRSVTKYEGWVWLLDEGRLTAAFAAAGHKNYGCPKLKVILDYLGSTIAIAHPGHGHVEFGRMSRGLPCRPGCGEGCSL